MSNGLTGTTKSVHAQTFKVALILALVALARQETFKLITFKKLDVGTFTNENFLETIDATSEKNFALSKSVSSFPLATGKFIILIQVKNRGATHILPSVNTGSQAQQYSSQSNVLEFDAMATDIEGTSETEDYLIVKKEFTQAGVLSVLCLEQFGSLQTSDIIIKSKTNKTK